MYTRTWSQFRQSCEQLLEQPKAATSSQVTTIIQEARKLVFWNVILISVFACSKVVLSIVVRYQRFPPFLVSTSDQNGAIILWDPFIGNDFEACSYNDESIKDMKPLLQTCKYKYDFSKKCMFFFSFPEMKLKWAFLIMCPSFVYPSVCKIFKISSFSSKWHKLIHFKYLLQNHWPNFNQT